jgi:GntR family transcriptional regulator
MGATRASLNEIELQESGQPLYRQVMDAIRNNLDVGIWKPGDQLPTETELSVTTSVSEGTIRQAVLGLVQEGRLVRRSGKGTFVTRPSFDRSFNRFFRFRTDEVAANPLIELSVIDLKRHPVQDSYITAALRLKRSDPTVVLHRAISADGVTVCHYYSYLAAKAFPKLERQALSNVALYDFLEREYGVYVVRAVETLQAGTASAEDASILKIAKGSPIIAIQRIAYSHGDTVVEIRRTVGRSDIFQYQIELS